MEIYSRRSSLKSDWYLLSRRGSTVHPCSHDECPRRYARYNSLEGLSAALDVCRRLLYVNCFAV